MIQLRYMRLCTIALLIGLCAPSGAIAGEILNTQYDYAIYPPEGWIILDDDPSALSFSDGSGQAIIQLFAFPAATYDSATDILTSVATGLIADSEYSPFQFQHYDAQLANLAFDSPRGEQQGYAIVLDESSADAFDYALLGFGSSHNYAAIHDMLISTLNSFIAPYSTTPRKGLISTFYSSTDITYMKEYQLSIDDQSIRYRLDPNSAEASQLLIEREALILQQYAYIESLRIAAWTRYYRLIYRDNYNYITDLSRSLIDFYKENEISYDEIPAHLLALLQNFEYTRNWTLSDFISPITALIDQAGDCDSIGLLYVTLLRQMGYDTILLVSIRHAHALVGVDIGGAGARFDYEGIDYLLGDITADDVTLGLIPAHMANAADWDAIRLR